MTKVRVALLGSGFMGKSHAIGFHSVVPTFGPLPVVPEPWVLFDVTDEAAKDGAARLGFPRWTTDWEAAVTDPAVDVVDVSLPNHLHREVSLAALAAGKHVYCEKPLAPTAEGALEMAEAAERAGVVNLVGFNYLKNPMAEVAREIVGNGEIGEVVHFRATHNEDFLADPDRPFGWRCDRDLAGAGALGDLGSHAIAAAHRLIGEIREVCGQVTTVIRERERPEGGGSRAVTNDDQVQFLARFADGVTGSFEASRIAVGRKLYLTYEITGTRGTLFFDQERMNELQLFTTGGPASRRGFRRIQAGPEHPDYRAFLPVGGHTLGYNDQKVIEVRDLLRAIAGEAPAFPTFRDGWRVCRVVDAVLRSAETAAWVRIPEG